MGLDEDHYCAVAEKLTGGRLIPFLGAGANLCDRGDTPWSETAEFLPSGAELAQFLAARGRYPEPEEDSLVRVSQYVGAAKGEDELYLYLHQVFADQRHHYRPTSLHQLLARAARHLADTEQPQLLAVTTNYDDLLEQAFADAGLECDVVWYEAKAQADAHRRFLHRAPGKAPVVISRPNKYPGLPIDLPRPVVLKLHGCVNSASETDDSYVITEDSYIDYLSGSDVGSLIPIALWRRMTGSSLLFLGYSLSDWNLRVILNRIWGERKLGGKSWAIQREPSDPRASKIERTLWDARATVDLLFCDLKEYVSALDAQLTTAALGP